MLSSHPRIQIGTRINDLTTEFEIFGAEIPMPPLSEFLARSNQIKFWIAEHVVAFFVKKFGHVSLLIIEDMAKGAVDCVQCRRRKRGIKKSDMNYFCFNALTTFSTAEYDMPKPSAIASHALCSLLA